MVSPIQFIYVNKPSLANSVISSIKKLIYLNWITNADKETHRLLQVKSTDVSLREGTLKYEREKEKDKAREAKDLRGTTTRGRAESA